MKKQLKAVLMLMTAFVVLNAGCKKNDGPGSPCNPNAGGAIDADVQNAELLKLGADVPAQWYALAIKLSRTKYIFSTLFMVEKKAKKKMIPLFIAQ